MLDQFQETKKKEFVRQSIDLLIGRCYPLDQISSQRKKMAIQEEAEVFFRDHIQGMTGTDASHHLDKRFPSLNDRIKTELSTMAEKLFEVKDDLVRTEDVFKSYGLNVSFSSEKLRTLMKDR